MLHELTLTEAVGKLDDWQHGRSGGFVTGLFTLMGHADPQNFKRLAIAFPAMAQAYTLWNDDETDITEETVKQQNLFEVTGNEHNSTENTRD